MLPRVSQPNVVSQGKQPPRALALCFRCSQGLKLLTRDPWNSVLSASIKRAVEHYDCELLAFVYLPDHVRLIVAPRHADLNVARLLYMIKRTFAHWVKGELRSTNHLLFKQLTLREGPGRYAFRFWEVGPGDVRALSSPEAVADAVDAVHDSPVAAGLCDTPGGWKWSSWRQYHRSAHPPDRDLPRISAAPIRVSSALPSV
jgi:putative transposase